MATNRSSVLDTPPDLDALRAAVLARRQEVDRLRGAHGSALASLLAEPDRITQRRLGREVNKLEAAYDDATAAHREAEHRFQAALLGDQERALAAARPRIKAAVKTLRLSLEAARRANVALLDLVEGLALEMGSDIPRREFAGVIFAALAPVDPTQDNPFELWVRTLTRTGLLDE
jgi:hypothetical protein